MSLTLVILAAGLGSRYGGLKQLDAVGPAGETVLDYAVFDGLRAGFDRIVFVIRQEFSDVFQTQIAAKYAGVVRVDCVFQSLDDCPEGVTVPPGRTKPWGTGHAVWCARTAVNGPFAVINADDFYGRNSFVRLADFLRTSSSIDSNLPRFAMVGFELARTLSENGAVSRGICEIGSAGALRSVTEHPDIERNAVGTGRQFRGDEIVSMNCWGFTTALFPALERRLTQFLRVHGGEPKMEFYLPAAISAMIAEGEADVSVLPTQSSWFGVTYREDKARVAAALQDLVATGEYPEALWPIDRVSHI